MKKLQRLELKAAMVCREKGHTMAGWSRTFANEADAICIDCGKCVIVRAKPAANESAVGGEALTVTCAEAGKVETVKDVFDFFDADFTGYESMEVNNKRLSRRVYKDTSCGAWAQVEVKPDTKRCTETWSVRYAKIDGRWTLVSYLTGGAVIELADVPTTVINYFWPTAMLEDNDELQGVLDRLSDHRSDFVETYTFDNIRRPTGGQEITLHIGSIVEGIDAATQDSVTLPTTKRELRLMVEDIERQAKELWDETHGCEACGEESPMTGFRPINPECKECYGEGQSF